MCCSLCFLFKSLFFAIKNCCDEIICRFLCCGKKGAKCCCCICIKDINEREYNSNRHFFCYCYQEQGRCKWLNTCIRNKAQKKLLPIMLQFFILQLTTIGLEKAYNDINESSDFNNFEDKKNIIIFISAFILSLLLYYYLSFSFGLIFDYYLKNKKVNGFIEGLSNKIINGTYGILIFNSFYSFILSIMYFLKGLDEKSISFKNYVLIPIFMSKFYYFTFTYISSSYAEKKDGIELMSLSTLIAIYLTMWDNLIEYMSNNISVNILFVIQIGFSSFVIFVTLIILFMFLFFLNQFWLTFLYLFNFFFSFGGIWFCKCFKNHNFYKECRCCHDNRICCSKKPCQERCYNCLVCCFGEKNCVLFKERINDNEN